MLQNLKMFIVLMVASGALGFAWAAYQEVDRQKQEIQLLSELVIISQLRLNVLQNIPTTHPITVSEDALLNMKIMNECDTCHLDYEKPLIKETKVDGGTIYSFEDDDGQTHTIEVKNDE